MQKKCQRFVNCHKALKLTSSHDWHNGAEKMAVMAFSVTNTIPCMSVKIVRETFERAAYCSTFLHSFLHLFIILTMLLDFTLVTTKPLLVIHAYVHEFLVGSKHFRNRTLWVWNLWSLVYLHTMSMLDGPALYNELINSCATIELLKNWVKNTACKHLCNTRLQFYIIFF